MRPGREGDLAAHNRYQRRYFEQRVKPTMVPRDTPYLRRHIEEALAFAGVGAGDRVLEVGCGMGRYTVLLARRGVRVEGMDLSPVLLDRLRAYNRNGPGIPLYLSDVRDPPPALRGAFDVVLGLFTLHHVRDLGGCFAGVVRLLKPGGRVVFLEPNPHNPLYYVQILVTPGMTWQGERGILQMRSHPVFAAMADAGLSELALHRFGLFPSFLANRRPGAWLERLLERVPLWQALLPFQLFRARRP